MPGWRCISQSTPLLWVDIPTIDLQRKYKAGFFELFKTATERSFPHDLSLHLCGSEAKRKLQPFDNILPRVHSLNVQQANLHLIKALDRRRESFKRLNTAEISFSTSSFRPP